MTTLNRKLPPLSALVAFEAVARHLSVTQAAGELCLTQAAVSRKTRTLEDDLGVRLFQRLHRGLRLTPEGERLQAAVSASLERMAETSDHLRQRGRSAQVTVATSVAFATFWLMPRIPAFREAHPGIELRLTAHDPHVDPVREGVDAAIRYGHGDWPGLATTRLFADEIFPVCSPAYLRAHPGLTSVDALADHTLLHLDVAYPDWVDWGQWFRAQDRVPPGERSGLLFNTYTLLIQAAVAGQGVALGWRHLVADFLEAGQLVRPLAAAMRPPGAYHLVHPAATTPTPETQALIDWLVEAATADHDAA